MRDLVDEYYSTGGEPNLECLGRTEKAMQDDMMGLYKTAREAYEAGRLTGMDDAWTAAHYCASKVSSERETAGDDAGFHAAEDIGARMNAAKMKQRELVGAMREAACADQH